MDGDFKGDFTRDTFDKKKRFSRVLMQQGRVQLDADWNEQVDILLHYIRTLVTDLVGPYWGPDTPPDGTNGFLIPKNGSITDVKLQKGRYYVDGILCEKDDEDSFPLVIMSRSKESPPIYIAYLDIWEREVTSIEDDSIREFALGGPDTTSRAQVTGRVRIRPDIPSDYPLPPPDKNQQRDYALKYWSDWVKKWYPEARGSLEVRCNQDAAQEAVPQLTSPGSKYRGIENQLYRVEIHKGGQLSENPTFKWSRENGTAVFPIVDLAGEAVTVKHLERGGRFGLKANDWVEIVDDDSILEDSPAKLLQVDKVDHVRMQVTLTDTPKAGQDQKKHPYLRRCDQQAGDPDRQDSLKVSSDTDGAALIEKDNWLSLEDGIQIKFLSTGSPTYRSGDYWLIPARTSIGDVQWPQLGDGGPRGIEHHFAPLAIILTESDGVSIKDIIDLRNLIKPEGQATISASGSAATETSTSAGAPAAPGAAKAPRRRASASGGGTPEAGSPSP
jgi:hypothetical protein